jgi:hypothetical protein
MSSYFCWFCDHFTAINITSIHHVANCSLNVQTNMPLPTQILKLSPAKAKAWCAPAGDELWVRKDGSRSTVVLAETNQTWCWTHVTAKKCFHDWVGKKIVREHYIKNLKAKYGVLHEYTLYSEACEIHVLTWVWNQETQNLQRRRMYHSTGRGVETVNIILSTYHLILGPGHEVEGPGSKPGTGKRFPLLQNAHVRSGTQRASY